MNKKKIIPIVLVLGVAAFLSWKLLHKEEFLFAGTIEATEVDISPRLSSLIASLKVDEGQTVSKGQVLVELDSQDLKLAFDIAEREYKRAQNLIKSESIPRENYDRIEYKYKDTQMRLDWCTIVSPLNGTVLNKYHENGEYVNVGTKLLTLADLDEVWAIIYLPQNILSKISLEMKVKGIVPEMGTRTFEGRITHINDEAEFTPKNVQTREERTRLVFGVKVTFPNPDKVLKPGMTIEVRLPQ